MRGWLIFWTINLIVAGATFAGITLIVGIKGVKDLRDMISSLRGVESDRSVATTPDEEV